MDVNFDKANELISLGQFEEAKKLLADFTESEHKVEALKLTGLCNVNLGLFKEGKSNFETVVKYAPDDATSWFYLANCYDNLDDFLHAQPAYLKVIELREGYLEAYKNLGVLYIKNKAPAKAFDLAQKALKFEQEDYLLYYMAGTALLAENDFTKSIEFLEKALALNPTHTQIYNNLGTAYLSTGKFDLAFEMYSKSNELNPRNAITLFNIGSILQIQNRNEEACEYFKKAYSLESLENYLVSWALSEIKCGRFADAAKHYKKLIELHPEKPNFRYSLACCYEKMQEYIFAIGILEQLILTNPKSKVMLQKLANLYLLADKPSKAKMIYEKLLNQGQVSEEIYYEYALVCVKTDDLYRAETILKKVIELNPKAAYARKDLGVIYLNKRLFDYAKDEFENAYSIAPDDVGILYEYANFKYAISDFNGAQELYKKLLKKTPKSANAFLFAALNENALNNNEDAAKYIQKALKLAPEDSFILFAAGKINFALKDYEKALVQLIHSWEQNKTVETENLLALTYFELGEYEKANTIFLSLLEKNPMNTNLLLNTAKCFWKLGDIDAAKDKLKNALEIFPEMQAAMELLAKIEK